MQALSGRPVYTTQWDARVPNNMAHIDLSREADAIVIAPASTDFLAKLAHGMCDDLLSTLCVARDCPLLVVPAMNRQMWQNPATQRNVAQLRARRRRSARPGLRSRRRAAKSATAACSKPRPLLEAIVAFFQPKILRRQARADHRRPDVRAARSGTRHHQPLVAARWASRWRAPRTGRRRGPPDRRPRRAGHAVGRVPRGRADRAADARRGDALGRGRRHLHRAWPRWPTGASITPASTRSRRPPSSALPSFTFVENPDILASVAKLPHPPFCVGFAAESGDLECTAKKSACARMCRF